MLIRSCCFFFSLCWFSLDFLLHHKILKDAASTFIFTMPANTTPLSFSALCRSVFSYILFSHLNDMLLVRKSCIFVCSTECTLHTFCANTFIYVRPVFPSRKHTHTQLNCSFVHLPVYLNAMKNAFYIVPYARKIYNHLDLHCNFLYLIWMLSLVCCTINGVKNVTELFCCNKNDKICL